MGIMGTLVIWVVNADNEFIVHDTENWTITVYSQDYSYWITIQDKNLWAGYVGDYGYYFQWWNNHGNPANSETVTQLVDWNDSYENHWYDWEVTKFIKMLDWSKFINTNYDYWTETSWGSASTVYANWTWNNLRWGGSDNEEQENVVKWYDTSGHVATNVDNRQWPCGEWYHVPSAWEWQELMMLRCNANSDICSWSVIGTNTNQTAWANYLSGNGIWTAFSSDLLPLAGNRDYYGGTVYGKGLYAIYWSSSPRGGAYPEGAWYLYLNPNKVDPSFNRVRASGQSIRCFKNSYVKLPKTLNLFFMSDDEEVGTGTITENMTGSIPASAESVSRTWYELLYWSLSGADAEFDFATTPISWDWADESGNVYFIVKWTPVEYTISYELDWWTNSENNTWKYTIETPDITLENPTKDWLILSDGFLMLNLQREFQSSQDEPHEILHYTPNGLR